MSAAALRQLALLARTLSSPTRGLRSYSVSAAEKPLLLYSADTPNGRKVSVLLEELKAAHGLDYQLHKIDISRDVQKEPWFIKMNPNGRIPVLVDRARGGFTVFETAAVLLYLEQHYDQETRFAFDPAEQPDEYSEMLQWMFWAHGGLGPMQGQANYFINSAPVDIPYAKKRYLDETERLYGVMEIRLENRDHLAGPGKGKYTIADMNAQPWVAGHRSIGIGTLDKWPNLKSWFEWIANRRQVVAGYEVYK